MTDVIVCGCNRTGTSLMAKLLVQSGLDILEPLVQANAGNPTGYWENVRFKELVVQYMNDPEPRDRPYIDEFGKLMNRTGNWVWKFPSAVLILNLLRTVSPNMKVVFMYRDRASTISSMFHHAVLTKEKSFTREYYEKWFDATFRAFHAYTGRKMMVQFAQLVGTPEFTIRDVRRFIGANERMQTLGPIDMHLIHF